MNVLTRWAIGQLQKQLAKGNAEAVVELGEHVVAHEDEDLEAFVLAAFGLALGYERLERWDRALHWFEECLTLDPANPVLLSGRGRVLMKMGLYDKAAVVFQSLARQYSDRAEYNQAAGSALLRTGQVEQALQYLRRASEIEPKNPYVLNDLGAAYFLLGEPETALGFFRLALAHVTPAEGDLVGDIQESIEEVRAALALRERASQAMTRSAKVIDLYQEGGGTETERTREVCDRPRKRGEALADSRVRAVILEKMSDWGCRPRQILAALHLWFDFTECVSQIELKAAEQRPAQWAAAAIYTVGRLDGERWGVQRVVADRFGISPASVSKRFARLRKTLGIEIGDPRYCSRPSRRREDLIQQIRGGRLPADQLLL